MFFQGTVIILRFLNSCLQDSLEFFSNNTYFSLLKDNLMQQMLCFGHGILYIDSQLTSAEIQETNKSVAFTVEHTM